MVEDHLEMLTTTYMMSVFNDKDISVYTELWDSFLIFTKCKFIRLDCFGHYEYLLFYLSHLFLITLFILNVHSTLI